MFSERVQSGRAGQRDQTRERVVECAQRLFAERGFAATTVRQIAAEAGVSVGTVMGVGDKDALLLAAFDGWIGAVHNARDVPARVSPGADPVTRIGDAVAPFLDLFDADMSLAREYGAVLARGGAATEVFGELAIALHYDFAAVFADAGLGEDAPRAARAVYFAYLGLVMTSAVTGSDAASIRNELESVAAVILRSPRKDS
ncbi:TetR family transcriptional regulator [Gordonia sp. HY002]|uniref:TetR/AcrR family transcriptional regulator n=1 Tax=Gordonia zhenghanii TaxID=2911516 RepID=UPI001EF0F5C7|nr:TetR/AcrR family transcriptional regulator [Gordonia zhenghanii]MCF8569587.1 TetR family transcriptional regulator [Gordonia zhenghanii]MCF8602892.1 TetR family transcriptional regulator [Gordonia zhenghanii]